MLNGEGYPVTCNGQDGDFYVDTLNDLLYGPKYCNNWGIGRPLRGIQGPPGAPGPAGPAGSDGSCGSCGSQGGTQIFSGDSPPSPVLGSIGDLYLWIRDPEDGGVLLWGPKPSEFAWGDSVILTGPQGEPGESGSNGAPGTQILSGIIPPTEDQGSLGDFYIQTSDSGIIFYGPKTGSGWGTGIVIQSGSCSCSSESCSNSVEFTDGNLFTLDAIFNPVAGNFLTPLLSSDGDTQFLNLRYGQFGFYSSDGGDTYIQTSIDDVQISNLEFIPVADINSDGTYIITAFITQGLLISDTVQKVYTSVNGGESFNIRYTASTETIIDVTATQSPLFSNQNLFTYMTISSDPIPVYTLYISTDGIFWNSQTISVPNLARIDAYTLSGDGQYLYLSFYNTADEYSVTRSNDLGNTWSTPVVFDALPTSTIYNRITTSYTGEYLIVGAVAGKLFQSSDANTSLTMTQFTISVNSIFDVQFIKMSDDGLYQFIAAIEEFSVGDRRPTVYYSVDSGTTWSVYSQNPPNRRITGLDISGDASTLLITYVNGDVTLITGGVSGITQSIIINGALDQTLWGDVGMSDDGTYRIASEKNIGTYVSSDGGKIWNKTLNSQIFLGSENYPIFNDTDNTGQYMVVVQPNIVNYSLNFGVTWSSTNFVLPGNPIAQASVRQVSAAPDALLSVIIYRSTGGRPATNLYLLTKDGVLTEVINNDDWTSLDITADGSFSYLTTNDGRVYIFNNNAITPTFFLAFNAGVPIRHIVISNNQEHILIGGIGAYLSTDGDPLMQVASGDIFALGMSNDGRIQYYVTATASNDIVIYESNDFGQTWVDKYYVFGSSLGREQSVISVSGNGEEIMYTNSGLTGIYVPVLARILDSIVPRVDRRADIGLYNRRYRNLFAQNAYLFNDPVITSDERLKTDIKDISLGIDFIKKVRPVEYRLIKSPEKIHYGVIAQELAATLKEHNVKTDSVALYENVGEFYGVRYSELIAPLMKANQELISIIERQTRELDELEAVIDGIIKRNNE